MNFEELECLHKIFLLEKMIHKKYKRIEDLENEKMILQKSGLFKEEWYWNTYPEVGKCQIDAITHFLTVGEKEGKDASEYFSSSFYLDHHQDVKESGMSPILHYILYGKLEERITSDFSNKIDEWISNHILKIEIKENPLVSIILPTKNRINLLPEAIKSVLNQTYQNWELLIVDDHSSDGTPKMIEEKFLDKRIKLFTNKGKGVSSARNTGLENSLGEYVAYLDSDNKWTQVYLEYMIKEFLNTSQNWAYAILKRYESFTDEKSVTYFCKNFNYQNLTIGNYIDLNIFMHKKELFELYGGFNEDLKILVDWDLILRYTSDENGKLNYFIGCFYDNSSREDRITNAENMENAYYLISEKFRKKDKFLDEEADINE